MELGWVGKGWMGGGVSLEVGALVFGMRGGTREGIDLDMLTCFCICC